MSDDKFKISSFRFDDPQTIQLLYTEFNESKFYPGNFESQIVHNGKKLWWRCSQMVYDNIKNLGAVAGDWLVVTRKEGKKGSYTDVAMRGDITTQPQNQNKKIDNRHYAEGQDSGRDFEIPVEAYMGTASFQGNTTPDSTNERIIRGQCFNNAALMLSGRASAPTISDVKQLTLKLHDEFSEWLRNGKSEIPFS